MPATLRALLDQRQFEFHPVAGFHEDVLDQSIKWVHSSDLDDPTPWLEPSQVLLTDGVQFRADRDPERARQYVARLQTCGVLALGFATGIAHDTIPAPLVAACEDLRFPLFEISERTPFMAIIRYVADVISSEQRERLEWSLHAQRAVARAALRPDGLGAILLELEQQLDCWVALYDAVGNRVEVGTRLTIPAEIERGVTAAVEAALARGTRAGARIDVDGGGATLQTLGQRGRLRGILAVGTGTPLDTAETDLVASVIGLASIALEQSRNLELARLRVRAGVLELLLSGAMDVAGQTANRLWGALPSAPLRVAVLAGDAHGPAILEELELYADRHAGRVFFAERDREVVIVLRHDDADAVAGIIARHGIGVGYSASVGWSELDRGLVEARKAARRASSSRPEVLFESLATDGVLGYLDASGVEPVARRMLAPVLDSANPDHRMLLKTAAVWLEHNGAWDPAARDLNVHRHTLRNRLLTLEGLLDFDLSRFADRAELWSALQFVEYPGKEKPAAP